MIIGEDKSQCLASRSMPFAGTGHRGGKPIQTHHRAIFVSDIHLGSGTAKSLKFLDFLETNTADTVYLVGDIVDNWHPLWRGWSADHHLILRRLLELPLAGTRVVYIPGNHDAFFRRFAGATFNGIDVAANAVHVAADGRAFLVVHGYCCDVFAVRAFILAFLGYMIERSVRGVDAVQRRALRRLLPKEWEGLDRAIAAVNKFFRQIDRFEERLTDLARHGGHDGVICGHFHQSALKDIEGLVYANCGDWVGSNTAIAEGFDGRLSLLEFSPTDTRTTDMDGVGNMEGELALKV